MAPLGARPRPSRAARRCAARRSGWRRGQPVEGGDQPGEVLAGLDRAQAEQVGRPVRAAGPAPGEPGRRTAAGGGRSTPGGMTRTRSGSTPKCSTISAATDSAPVWTSAPASMRPPDQGRVAAGGRGAQLRDSGPRSGPRPTPPGPPAGPAAPRSWCRAPRPPGRSTIRTAGQSTRAHTRSRAAAGMGPRDGRTPAGSSRPAVVASSPRP